MKTFIKLGLAVSSLFLVTLEAQGATFIDTFEQGIIDLEVSPTNLVESSSVSSSSILGGTRNIELLLTVAENQAFATTNLFTGNNFSHSNNTGASSIATITYDSAGNGLGVNLLELGDSFAIDITDLDLTTQFAIVLEDGQMEISSVVSESISEPQQIMFNFADFKGIDLTSIDEINLISQGGLNVDVQLDSFSIVDQRNPNNQPQIPIGDTPIKTFESATVFGLIFSLGLSIFSRKKLN